MRTPSDDEIQALLADVWQRHLPALHERLNLLQRAAESSATGNLSEAARAEAQSTAHKLAGNLGMFGHQEAGDIAGHIEQALKSPTPGTALATLVAKLRQSLAAHI